MVKATLERLEAKGQAVATATRVVAAPVEDLPYQFGIERFLQMQAAKSMSSTSATIQGPLARFTSHCVRVATTSWRPSA